MPEEILDGVAALNDADPGVDAIARELGVARPPADEEQRAGQQALQDYGDARTRGVTGDPNVVTLEPVRPAAPGPSPIATRPLLQLVNDAHKVSDNLEMLCVRLEGHVGDISGFAIAMAPKRNQEAQTAGLNGGMQDALERLNHCMIRLEHVAGWLHDAVLGPQKDGAGTNGPVSG